MSDPCDLMHVKIKGKYTNPANGILEFLLKQKLWPLLLYQA